MSTPTKPTYSITTPIYYVNAAPHLGTAYTTIAADAVARYQRMNGYDVAFVTGTDEHGQKVAETAEKSGMTPQEWCDSLVPAFKETWDLLDITYTDFVRTTDDRQTRTVRKFWGDLYDKGYLYKGKYEGWYCVHEETYYNEGDLEKNEDGEYICPDCKRPVRRMASGEENWFFKLSEFQDKLLKFYDDNPDFIQPVTRRNEIVSFVSRGLQDLSISRSTFDWGIPLPFDEGHVCYVWADALLAYPTGIGYGDPEREDEFNARWPFDYHFVGKDITRFHCVIWPAMLMAAGMPLPKRVFGHGFLLVGGEKMSKSKGNGIKPKDLVDIYGSDAYRYYFLSDVRFGQDGNISVERMTQVYNADLANTWGNLVSRTFNMVGKYFNGKVPEVPAELAQADNPLKSVAEGLYEDFDACMTEVNFTDAVARVQELAGAANHYIEDSVPWNLAKSEETRGQLAFVLYNTLEACRIIALFMAPFMPRTSQEVFRRLGLGDVTAIDDIKAASAWGQLPAGNAVEKGDPLFPRLQVEDIQL
jgi:methionyl-tRNA synthetase